MPENWTPNEQVEDKVVVPIIKGIASYQIVGCRAYINTNNGIPFIKAGENDF